MSKSSIRLIDKKEIKYCASILADCFVGYPLYRILFANDKTRKRNIRLFYEVSLYARREYTYVSDDLSFIGCIKRPNDKEHSLIGTIFSPRFFFRCLPIINLKFLFRFKDFYKKTNELRNENYDPSKDIYIEAIGIKEEKRSLNYFISLFKNNYNGENIYAETMDEKLIKLYDFIGLKEKGKTEYKGYFNHVFKKESNQ